MWLSVVPGREQPLRNTLPPSVTDRDKWEKADDIPCVQDKNMAKPQKFSFSIRQKTTKETVPALQGHPEVSRDRRRRARSAPSFFLLKRVRYLRQAVDLANFFSGKTLVSCLVLVLQRHEVVVNSNTMM